MSIPGRVGFAVGTGRCGTYFLHRVLLLEPQVASSHERNPLNETFHRYSKWYGLPMDHGGFLHTKQVEIREDLKAHSFSFEASAHLSLSVVELFREFEAKFVLLVRSPERVVNSYLDKGWYKEIVVRDDPDLPPSFQDSGNFHHFLGRILPSGSEFLRWRELTRVGKLAWYWSALNEAVINQFAQLPKLNSKIIKLEELDYQQYQQLCKFFSVDTSVSSLMFEAIAASRPNRRIGKPSIREWSDLEISEFKKEVEEIAGKLGYDPSYAETLARNNTVSQGTDFFHELPLIPRVQRILTRMFVNLRARGKG